MSTLWQYSSYICAGTLDFLSQHSSLGWRAQAQHTARHSRGSNNRHRPSTAGKAAVCLHFMLVLGQTGHYLAPQEQTPDTSYISSRTHPTLSARLQDDPEIQYAEKCTENVPCTPSGCRESPCSWRNSVAFTLLTKNSSRHPPIPTDISKEYFN